MTGSKVFTAPLVGTVGAGPAGPVLAGPLFIADLINYIQKLRARLLQPDHFKSSSYAPGSESLVCMVVNGKRSYAPPPIFAIHVLAWERGYPCLYMPHCIMLCELCFM